MSSLKALITQSRKRQALVLGTTVSYVKYREANESANVAKDALSREFERVSERDVAIETAKAAVKRISK